MRRVLLFALVAVAPLTLTLPRFAVAQLPVFSGDPVDPGTGDAYTILPGVANVQPGDDEKFNTDDDVINTGVIGDVDIVVRTGGTFAGGAIPAPAAGVAAAPAIVPGGTQLGSGSEVAFQVIVSDGASSPAAGNPLLSAAHDNRAVVVLAYPDLDGDGYIGPTNADGSADNALEKQEVVTVVGRQVGLIQSGVGSGGLGVALGAPASSGGLATVVVAGALMGVSSPKYFDGPWAGTLMPAMPPIDSKDLIGGGNGTLAPNGMTEEPVEVFFEYEKWFRPNPGHPLLGTPYAIPTDGSSITTDLLRAESGPATSAVLAVPVQAAGFVASPSRRLLPAVGSGGQRQLVERVDSITLADDGSATKSLLLFATDLLGNPADVTAPISTVVEVGVGLAITSPDVDANPLTEPVTISSATGVTITIADAGGAGDRLVRVPVMVSIDGVPAGPISIVGGTLTCPDGIVDVGEQCDDGNYVNGDGCESNCTLSSGPTNTPTPTATVAPTATPTAAATLAPHDSVVLPPAPLAMSIPAGATSATKVVRVKVRNADVNPDRESPGHLVKLIAADGTCPAGTVVGLPDFGRRSSGSSDVILLAGGKTATAKVTVRALSSVFASVNHDAPARCTIDLSVVTSQSGTTDPAPSNDAAPLEVSVVDFNDAEQATSHESTIASVKPLAIKIGAGATGATKTIRAVVVNADAVPSTELPGHAIEVVTSDGDCPTGTIAAADFDSMQVGAQTSATVRGGAKARAAVTITIDASVFQSASGASPARCTALLSVTGPGGDADSANDSARLTIDVTDGNDVTP